jgi:hypothetical protein
MMERQTKIEEFLGETKEERGARPKEISHIHIPVYSDGSVVCLGCGLTLDRIYAFQQVAGRRGRLEAELAERESEDLSAHNGVRVLEDVLPELEYRARRREG